MNTGSIVRRLRRVFFEMNTGEGDAGELATRDKRIFVLTDLIAFRNIRVEILLSIPLGEIGNSVFPAAGYRMTDFQYVFDRLMVEHRQSSRVRHTNRTNIHIWPFLVRVVRACAKHLALRGKLSMH